MEALLLLDPEEANQLVHDIVDKALGVFLWVFLVVRTLVSGLSGGDEIFHLRTKIEALPSELEDLYGDMFRKIDPVNRQESSKMFQIFRESGHSLGLLTLERALRHDGHRQALELPVGPRTISEAEKRKIDLRIRLMKLRLNSRSMGLLEVSTKVLYTENASVPKKDTHNSNSATRSSPSVWSVEEEIIQSPTESTVSALKKWGYVWTSCGETLNPVATSTSKGPYHLLDLPQITYFLKRTFPRAKDYLVQLSYVGDEKDDITIEHTLSRVSYLHRTVRDYLEQDNVWAGLKEHTKDTGFNPRTAILVALVLELKSSGRISKNGSVYSAGIEVLASVCKLSCLDLDAQVLLLEELGRSLGAYWIGEVPTRSINKDPWRQDNEHCRRQWQGGISDVLPKIMWSMLGWYVDTKLSDSILLDSVPCPSLLTHALGSEFWRCRNTLQSVPIPQSKLVERLLCLGCDPNATYEGSSIWASTISYLHILKSTEETCDGSSTNLSPWVHICRLLLEHGADPYACCVMSYHRWWLGAKPSLAGAKDYNPRDTYAKDSTLILSEESDGLQVEKACSASDVLSEVFLGEHPAPGARALMAVLHSKKSQVRDSCANATGKSKKRKRNRQRQGGKKRKYDD